jgi:hypothetical protein
VSSSCAPRCVWGWSECQRKQLGSNGFSCPFICHWKRKRGFPLPTLIFIAMEGYLWKMGEKHKAWKMRFFVISKRRIYYYSKQEVFHPFFRPTTRETPPNTQPRPLKFSILTPLCPFPSPCRTRKNHSDTSFLMGLLFSHQSQIHQNQTRSGLQSQQEECTC